jgi:hypothetical protein
MAAVKIWWAEMSRSKHIIGRNGEGRNDMGRNDSGPKRQRAEMVFHRGPKWQWAEMTMGRIANGPKWQWAEMPVGRKGVGRNGVGRNDNGPKRLTIKLCYLGYKEKKQFS